MIPLLGAVVRPQRLVEANLPSVLPVPASAIVPAQDLGIDAGVQTLALG